MNSWAILILVVFFSLNFARANEPRLDRNGDPLPEGAVARFGSARLLHGGVQHLEFSPDGKVLASAGQNGVRLWDTADGKLLPGEHLPRMGDSAFAFLPDGAHLVGDSDGCRVVEPRTGKVRCSWHNGGRAPRSLAVSADGKTAAVVWYKGGLTVHDLTRSGERNDRKVSDDEPRAVGLSGDGSLLAFDRRTDRRTIVLWDVRQGRPLHTYAAKGLHDYDVYTLCLSNDGRRLAASWGQEILIWDTTTHRQIKQFVRDVDVSALALRFFADGKELAGLTPYQEVWRWSLATEKEPTFNRVPQREKVPFWVSALSPDGRRVAGTYGGAIRLWDAESWKPLVDVERWPDWHFTVFTEPGVIAMGSREADRETIAFWNVRDGRLLRKLTVPAPEDEAWHRVLSPDGKLLAVSNQQKGILLIDVETGKEVRHFDVPRREDLGAKFAFSPDGKTLITTDHPKGFMLWDLATGKALYPIQGDASGWPEFSPDGRLIASAFVTPLYLTEVASGKARYRLTLPDSEERRASHAVYDRIRFSRDSRSVLVVSECDIYVFSTVRGDTNLHIELARQEELYTDTGALSPDGRWLAHADNKNYAVAVRDLKNPLAIREYQTLPGHAGRVNAVEFSPDGKYLVSGSDDGTALIWDVAKLTGKPNRPLPKPTGPEAVWTSQTDDLWAVLSDADANRAAKAMAVLAEFPDYGVEVVKERLRPIEAVPAERIERMIADLDSKRFAVRDQAVNELARIGEQAEPALRKALEGSPSAEVVRQVKQLLREREQPLSDPEQLRLLRAIEVLERIGTPEARKVLQTLAKGAPASTLTREAKRSLERWPIP